ncbi:hypothetical protein GQF01_31660 [Paenibacillus sp. 5J-6]|uniref:Dockerin domain-containing protein n=1 Tax=Paenibacillus silvestris TaxID=2606219 RepID=A0A6L8V8K6_9BACL|nr:dockerin type I domain-containing protein [Paenibacillus silvestris]MZQ86673.1 hypothetical protein [Paenibacillus silvestris]
MNAKKKILSSVLGVSLLFSMAPAAFATNNYYPSNQGPSQAQPPAGREYFPTDISKLPSSEGLPDLFKQLDPTKGTNGSVTTKEEWTQRRSELSDLLQYYYYGYEKKTAKENVSYSGNLGTSNATLTVTVKNPENDKSGSYNVTGIYIPTYKEGVADADLKAGETNIAPPYPFVIGVGGGVSANMRNAFLRRGYAVMNNPTGTIYSDNASRSGLYTTLYPFNKDTYEGNSGALMGWAWGISRTIDALENGAYQGLIDPTRSVVTGVSRNGKGAALAGAFDERIRIVVPVDPGQGGIASMRYSSEGRIYNYNVPNSSTGAPNASYSNSNMNRSFFRNEKPTNLLTTGEAHWLDVKAEDFRNELDNLPFDSHALAALVAPRPLITYTGEGFDWLSSPGTVLATVAAKEVYELLGVGDNIAVRVHDGAHAFQDRDHAYLLAIMDREFHGGKYGDPLKVEGPDTLGVNVNPPLHPAATYSSVWNMSVYPYEVDSSFIRWSQPGKYSIYTTNEMLTADNPATIKAYSDAPQVKLDTGAGTYTADVVQGVATFTLSADKVKAGRYTLSTIGSSKDNKSVYLQSYDLKGILRTSITGDDTGDQRWVFGFTSKVDKNAIKIFANNVPVPASVNEGLEPGWILPYGASINTGYSSADADNTNKHSFFQEEVTGFPASYAAGTNRVVRLEDVKLESLPGYNFQFSYDLNKNKSVMPPSWPSTNVKIGPSANWPQYPNKNTDTGARPESLPWPTTNLGAVTFNPSNAVITPDTTSVSIGFENAMDPQNFGFGTNFANDYTVTWSENNTIATIGFDKPVASGSKLILAQLKDSAGNANVQPYVFDLQGVNATSLTGPENVSTGDVFDLSFGLNGYSQDALAQDMTVTFNTYKLDFIAPASLNNDFKVVDYKVIEPGKIRLLNVFFGNLQGDPNGALLKLQFKAKPDASGDAAVTVSNVIVVGKDDVENEVAGTSHNIHITTVEKQDLSELIAEAQSTYANATEGRLVGQYPVGSKAALNTAISAALQIANDSSATQSAVDQAKTSLNEALQLFRSLVIVSIPGDTNNDNKVSVGDLSRMVKAYGKTSQDPDWNSVMSLDLNQDGFIDIEDLVQMAKLIFNW